MRKALLLCMLCLATSIVCAQEQQQQPPQLQVGDTITVNKDATHYLTGEKISKWVYRVTHRIRQIGSKQWKDGILIRGINSWLAPTSVTKVGEERPAVVEQPKDIYYARKKHFGWLPIRNLMALKTLKKGSLFQQ